MRGVAATNHVAWAAATEDAALAAGIWRVDMVVGAVVCEGRGQGNKMQHNRLNQLKTSTIEHNATMQWTFNNHILYWQYFVRATCVLRTYYVRITYVLRT